VLYADAIGEVVSDLMVRLRDERSRSPSGVLVGDVANLLYRFTLEGRGGPPPCPCPAPLFPSLRGSGMRPFPHRDLLHPLRDPDRVPEAAGPR